MVVANCWLWVILCRQKSTMQCGYSWLLLSLFDPIFYQPTLLIQTSNMLTHPSEAMWTTRQGWSEKKKQSGRQVSRTIYLTCWWYWLCLLRTGIRWKAPYIRGLIRLLDIPKKKIPVCRSSPSCWLKGKKRERCIKTVSREWNIVPHQRFMGLPHESQTIMLTLSVGSWNINITIMM